MISIMIDLPKVRNYGIDTYRQLCEAEEVVKQWCRWREPGGAIEVIQDHYVIPDGLTRWRLEVVYYDENRAEAVLFKLRYHGQDPMA